MGLYSYKDITDISGSAQTSSSNLKCWTLQSFCFQISPIVPRGHRTYGRDESLPCGDYQVLPGLHWISARPVQPFSAP